MKSTSLLLCIMELSSELTSSELGEHIIELGLDRGRLVSMRNLSPLEEIHQVLEFLGVLSEYCSADCRLLLVAELFQ